MAASLLALTALLVKDGGAPRDRYARQVAAALEPVVGANRSLSAHLQALRPRQPVGEVNSAVGRAQHATASGRATVTALAVPAGSRVLARRVRETLDGEVRYLIAVADVLANPSHPAASRAQALAADLVAALTRVDPPVAGAGRSVAGADDLARWAPRTAGRREGPVGTLERAPTLRTQRQAAAGAGRAAVAPRDEARRPLTEPVLSCGVGLHVGQLTSCELGRSIRDEYNRLPDVSMELRVYNRITNVASTVYCSPDGKGRIACIGRGSAGPISVWW